MVVSSEIGTSWSTRPDRSPSGVEAVGEDLGAAAAGVPEVGAEAEAGGDRRVDLGPGREDLPGAFFDGILLIR